MKKRIWWLVFLIFTITVFAGLVVWPKGPSFFKRSSQPLGLDLQGGVQLTYVLKTDQLNGRSEEEAQRGVIDVIDRRINSLGVSEPVIQATNIGNQPAVNIELPGVSDIEQAKKLIGQTAQLIFKEQGSDGLFQATKLTGSYLEKANATFDQGGGSSGAGFQAAAPIIELRFNKEGADLFRDLTTRNLQKPIAIELDGQILTAPTVQTTIDNGEAIITGIDSIQEAKKIATLLNAGALPVPIEPVSENKIGATLGQDSIRTSLAAGLLGVMLVVLFMIIYYRRAGLLAIIALGIYGLITLAIFKLIPITMTLAGIAGFLFSMGAAVDANVLVFERLKEEIKKGKESSLAIEDSFKRSWSSIWPSNMASLITATILYYGATGIVRGFAITLAIGILVSMFTAITTTRTLLRLWGQSIKRVTL
jgi:preprotein translocase subunit SecD